MSQNINVTVGVAVETVVFQGSGDALTFAESIAGAINGESAVVSGTMTDVISAGGAATVLPTYNAVLLTTSAPETIDALGSESLLGGGGNINFSGAANSTYNIALGAGADTIVTASGDTFNIHLGAGGDSIFANGSGTIVVGGGAGSIPGAASTIEGAESSGSSVNISASGNGDLIAVGSGNATIGEAGQNALIFGGSGFNVIADTGTHDTIFGGSGADTILGGTSSTIFLSTGTNTADLGASDTVAGQSGGNSTIFGGANDIVFTEASNVLFVSAAGTSSSIQGSGGSTSIFGAAGSSVDFFAQSTGNAIVVGGSGAETLDASGSNTPVVFYRGSGNDLLRLGSGSTTIAFINGEGNTDTIANIAKGDYLALLNYSANAAQVAVADKTISGGNTITSLPDGTEIVFAGYTGPLIAPGGDVITVCYAAGTRIRALRHGAVQDVAIEYLTVGDLVVTASGDHRPIRWLGHRAVDCRAHPRPSEVMPVRVAAHAFGQNRPARDLFVSPAHAICVDILGEVLIPVSSLLNGATVTQEDVERVTYWHVELDSHDVLLAENLPAESYLDCGNRRFFAESGVIDLAAGPDAKSSNDAFCHPLRCDGPVVSAVRSQLVARARSLGWMLADDPLADLHLVVDGARVEPIGSGLEMRFIVPAGASEILLASTASRPVDVDRGPDERKLGVAVARLSIDDGRGSARDIPLDDPSLHAGFHGLEGEGEAVWRWTSGRARLPAAPFADPAGVTLRVDLARPAIPRWVAPTAIAADPPQRAEAAGMRHVALAS